MKQTAVEWLFEQYVNKNIITIESLKKAKSMEKEQIIWAHGIQMKGVNNHKCVTGEQYYSETFKP